MSLDLGIGTFSGQRPADGSRSVADSYGDILAIGRTADSIGFDSLWVASHHGLANEHISAPLVVLAAVAAVTERIRLASAMVLAPFQSPIRFAEDCATVDQLSRGRLRVGLGVGWREEEFRQFGVPIGERGGRTAELAEFCRLAWDSDVVTFAGRYVNVVEVAVRPRPFGRIPIVMGGTAPAALRRTGRLADTFLGTGTPQAGVEAFRRQVEIVDAAAADTGRDPNQLTVGFQANCWVSRDGQLPSAVRAAMWSQIGASLSAHAGTAERPVLDEAEIRRRGFIGSPSNVVEGLRPWLGAIDGRNAQVVLRLHFPGLPVGQVQDAMELFAAEVAPALRDM